ncbi:MAG TPA: sterol desaturase family protein, partial [Micromonosporaceae bacterium]
MHFLRGLSPTELAVPGFILLMIIERLSFRFMPDPGERGYAFMDTTTSIAMGLGSLFADAAVGILTGAAAIWLTHATPLQLPSTIWTWLGVFVGWDLCYYWAHRASHEIRILWAGHVTHHSSQFYNLSTALR